MMDLTKVDIKELQAELEKRAKGFEQKVNQIITQALIDEAVAVYKISELVEVEIPEAIFNLTLDLFVEDEDVTINRISLTPKKGCRYLDKILIDTLQYATERHYIEGGVFTTYLDEMPAKIRKEVKKAIKPYQKKIKDFNKKVEALAKKHGVDAEDIWDKLVDHFIDK